MSQDSKSELDKFIADREKWNPNTPIYMHEIVRLAKAIQSDLAALRAEVEELKGKVEDV